MNVQSQDQCGFPLFSFIRKQYVLSSMQGYKIETYEKLKGDEILENFKGFKLISRPFTALSGLIKFSPVQFLREHKRYL